MHMDRLSKEKIREIAQTTFEITCYMFPLEQWELEEAANAECDHSGVRAMVGFGGAAEGGMIISPTEELLTAIAANMLGIESPTEEEEEGALCEIANIICGNTVPQFASNDKICHIHPPQLIEEEEDIDQNFDDMSKQSVQVFLDEGVADITFYYLIEEDE